METVKEILRAQYDGRKCRWRIVKKTWNGSGGWAKFGRSDGYWNKDAAEQAIDRLVENCPEMYCREDN